MTYSNEIPDRDREDVEREIDDAALKDIMAQTRKLLDALMDAGAGDDDTTAQAACCTVCGIPVVAVPGVIDLGGEKVILAITLDSLNDAFAAMLNHFVHKHTNGLNAQAAIHVALMQRKN